MSLRGWRNSFRRKKSTSTRIQELFLETEFTEAELKKWYRKFKKENPNGYITLAEIKNILR